MISLGVDEERIHYSDYFFTRLHMRYTPTEADEDLMLYHTNILDQSQIRYIEYVYELEEHFPVCGEGMVEEPGSCDSENEPGDDLGTPDVNSDEGGASNNTDLESKGCGGGCSSSGSFALFAWLSAAVFGVSRRREWDNSSN